MNEAAGPWRGIDHVQLAIPVGSEDEARVCADILGEGWEDLDMTLDQDGRLWVVTDTRWVDKCKKPGKLDFKARVRLLQACLDVFGLPQCKRALAGCDTEWFG